VPKLDPIIDQPTTPTGTFDPTLTAEQNMEEFFFEAFVEIFLGEIIFDDIMENNEG
jgi:hypothetical protein